MDDHIAMHSHVRDGYGTGRTWVAKVLGPCARYGLRREFLQPFRDWSGAHVARSGNAYGVVERYALRGGHLYEQQVMRGKRHKRYASREFFVVERGKAVPITPWAAITRVVCRDGHKLDMHDVPSARVAEVAGVGTPTACGWAVSSKDRMRVYSLGIGRVYEIQSAGRRLVRVDSDALVTITEQEALAWLVRQSEG